jgi:hypothetical protein
MSGTQAHENFFDEFFQSSEKKEEKSPLEVKISEERLKWTNKIEEMSKRMKKVFELSDLMTYVYTERQRGVEYHHYLISILSKINRSYRKQWSEKYNHYSYKSQKRFPNEKTKELQILSELNDIIKKRDLLDNHSKFIENTIRTIDNIIYGIKYRIEIEQIARGK